MGWRTKSIAQVQSEFDRGELKRTLGPIHLVLFGIGCIIGAGIFVRTGTAAALYAGPAVILSFVIAGVICALAGLCYAELASMLPVSGSAYTYRTPPSVNSARGSWARCCCSNTHWPRRWSRWDGRAMR